MRPYKLPDGAEIDLDRIMSIGPDVWLGQLIGRICYVLFETIQEPIALQLSEVPPSKRDSEECCIEAVKKGKIIREHLVSAWKGEKIQ